MLDASRLLFVGGTTSSVAIAMSIPFDLPKTSVNQTMPEGHLGEKMRVSRIRKFIRSLSESEKGISRNISNCICLQFIAALFVVSLALGVGLWK